MNLLIETVLLGTHHIYIGWEINGTNAPGLLNNVKIGPGQLSFIIEIYFVLSYIEVTAFWSSDLNNLTY